jgi:hypothetical protein
MYKGRATSISRAFNFLGEFRKVYSTKTLDDQ